MQPQLVEEEGTGSEAARFTAGVAGGRTGSPGGAAASYLGGSHVTGAPAVLESPEPANPGPPGARGPRPLEGGRGRGGGPSGQSAARTEDAARPSPRSPGPRCWPGKTPLRRAAVT